MNQPTHVYVLVQQHLQTRLREFAFGQQCCAPLTRGPACGDTAVARSAPDGNHGENQPLATSVRMGCLK